MPSKKQATLKKENPRKSAQKEKLAKARAARAARASEKASVPSATSPSSSPSVSVNVASCPASPTSASADNVASTPRPASPSSSAVPESASKRKLSYISAADVAEGANLNIPDTVAHLEVLQSLFENAVCGLCLRGTLKLCHDSNRTKGLSVGLVSVCQMCGAICGRANTSRKSSSQSFEVNRAMVAASLNVGMGHGGLTRFCEVLGVPSLHNKTYQQYVNIVYEQARRSSSDIAQQARSIVKDLYEPGADGIINISVTFDGTWHKRGHTSNHGAAVVICAVTGLVLDSHVMSLYCQVCKIRGSKARDPEEQTLWLMDHKESCHANYSGSSGGMEAEAAKVLWGRSMDYGLRYTTLIGDGDSKTFNAIQDLNPYNGVEVKKAECVNHVAKRLGTALRNLVNTEKKRGVTLGGRGSGTLTQMVAGVPREALVVSPGPVGSVVINRINNYLTKTGVENEFFDLLHKLMAREELPYNPYPGFAIRLRPLMEKFHVDSETEDNIEYALSVPLKETRILNLYTIQKGEPVWGLRSILRCVNAHAVNRYQWLCDQISPTFRDLFHKEDYSNQVMVAMIGGAVFQGSFYRQVHIAQFRLEYLITGKHIDEAVSMFVNSVIMDIDKIITSKFHILIGVNIPVLASVSEESGNNWQLEFWDPETIQSHKGTLMQKISDAVIGNKYIFAECVFQLDPHKEFFIQGQKQYTLNFVEVKDEILEEGLANFAEFPMGSLHEGIFLNQTHAECYISMFVPQTNTIDHLNIRRASANPSSTMKGGAGRRQSTLIEDDYHYIHRHVHQRMQHHKPRKALIDGFRLGDDPGSGPFAWQITSPFKGHLQKRIVSFHPWAQLFDIVYHLILLVLMDRKTTDVPILMELYKMCNSTAGKVHMLGEQNKAARALIRAFINRDDGHRMRPFLAHYRQGLEEVLGSSLHERSNDQICTGKAMSAQVSDLLNVSDAELRSPAHLNLMILVLRDQHSFMLTLLMRMSEDVLTWAPLVKDQIDQLHFNFPECVPKPANNVRNPRDAGPRDRLPKSVYMNHGYEDEHIMKHEHSVINVPEAMKQGGFPGTIAKEAVLMLYFVDTHLEETWEKFLEDCFEKRRDPPPNPYPSLINKLRECAMRMDLCYSQESVMLDRILTNTAKPVDEDNYVFQLPSCQACGPVTAVTLIDPGAFVPLWKCISDFLQNKTYIHRKGPYRIGICLGLTGPSTLYGRMRPYLCQVDLHEHYYIQGPLGCEGDAAQLLAVMVQRHVYELVTANQVVILGVYLGKDRVRWSWEQVINKKLGFFTEVEAYILRKEPILLKTYVPLDGWRYIPVVKHFLLHYLTDDGLSNECLFEEDVTHYYTTIFNSVERAAFQYQNDGPPRGGNPVNTSNKRAVLTSLDNKLIDLKNRCNWMEAYRMLLLRSLLCDNTLHIVEAWNVFHSMAGQAEYVAFLAMALAELVEFELEYSKFYNVRVSTAGTEEQTDVQRKSGGSPVNLGMLSAMLTAILERGNQVAQWRISQSSTSLPELIAFKLSYITEADAHTKKMYPIIAEETVSTLEEIQHMFLNIRTTISNDVHNMNNNAMKTLAEIPQADEIRPQSVDSEILNDPQLYQRRPRAGHKVLEDDMLYKTSSLPLYKPKV